MIIERDPAMERRLQPVYVDELDKEASVLVLKNVVPSINENLILRFLMMPLRQQ